MKTIKIKTGAALAASLAMFAMTYFAMAQNQNGNNIFLDSDQDGLTNQEEKTLGTDPKKPDTDSDGYSDEAEVRSGYDPLKPAPGDQLFPASAAVSQNKSGFAEAVSADNAGDSLPASATNLTSLLEQNNQLSSLAETDLSSDIVNDFSSDPDNPNLTNEMIGNLMQQTIDKSQNSADAAINPTFSQDDLDQIVQSSLASANVQKEMPEIRDDEIKILPPVDDSPRSLASSSTSRSGSSGEAGKKLDADEIKAAQKKEIETYLSSLAFVFAQNSPFPIDNPDNIFSSLDKESNNILGALSIGNQKKIDDYAQKTRAAIDQTKKIEVPYVMKDLHKSALQMSIYTLDFKNDLALNPSDPAKSLAAMSSLQTMGSSVLQLQGKLQSILNEYGISKITTK